MSGHPLGSLRLVTRQGKLSVNYSGEPQGEVRCGVESTRRGELGIGFTRFGSPRLASWPSLAAKPTVSIAELLLVALDYT